MTPELYTACAEAIHVITADGEVLRAGRASLFILEELGWGGVVRLLSRPPFFPLVEWGYRLVADHRRFFSRFFFRSECGE